MAIMMVVSFINDRVAPFLVAASPTLLGCASVLVVLFLLYTLAAPPIPRVILKEPSGKPNDNKIYVCLASN